MLRKNLSEKRFHTAGARIPISRKLPSDFFTPNLFLENRETSNFLPL